MSKINRANLWKVRKQIEDRLAAAGATDLTISRNATTVTVESSTGDDVGIPGADATTAGILTAAEFSRLQGIPSGGTTGQVLTKTSGSDYDTEWAAASGGGNSCLINGGNAFSVYCSFAIVSISPDSGPIDGGTSVTITGRGFDTEAASTTVTIGGSSATSVSVVNRTTITCDTPTGAVGSVDIVIDQDGEVVSSVDAFTYTDNGILGSLNPIHWYDVAQESYTDASSVGTWTDRGSDGADLTQATGSKQPTYDAANDWLEFDESASQIMQTSGSPTVISQPTTKVFVGEIVSNDAGQVVYDGQTSSNRQALGTSFSSTQNLSLFAGASGFTPITPGNQNMAVWIAVFDGSSSALYKDGVEVSTGNAGSNSGQGFSLGGRFSDTRHASINVHELAAIDGALTTQEISDVTAALKTKWGIS